MFSYIIGDVKIIEDEYIVLENNNIGFKLLMSKGSISKLNINESYKIYTEFVLREDGAYLYGFYSFEELNLFLDLISVSSIGPKAALSILSVLDVDEVKMAILQNDIKALTRAPGIGKKSASRIILDLSDRIDIEELKGVKPPKQDTIDSDDFNVALEALINLGYPRNEARRVLEKIDMEGKDLSDIIKEALKNF